MFLVSLPEVAYAKVGEEMVARWFPPKGMWFKFGVMEIEGEMSLEDLKGHLLVSDAPVQLTREEVRANKEKYGGG